LEANTLAEILAAGAAATAAVAADELEYVLNMKKCLLMNMYILKMNKCLLMNMKKESDEFEK
jgi:hypothetical protein